MTLGCTVRPPGLEVSALDLAWPIEAPKVRLASVIGLTELRGGTGARLLGRLVGEKRGIPVIRPFAVAWDGDDLLVTDPGSGRVLRVTSGGRLTASPERSFESPVAVAVCAGRVLVADSRTGQLVELGPDLRPASVLLSELDRPTAVACDGEQIWVLETAGHRLLSLQPDGSVRTIGERGDGIGQFNFPTAIAVAGDSLWIGDTLNFRIQRLTREGGKPLEAFGEVGADPGELPRLKGLAIDSGGHLWASDAHLDQVALFEPDGTYLMSLGGLGSEPGRFSFPAGIAAHADGRVAVVDSLNRRLQIFRVVGMTASDDSTAPELR